MKLPFERTMSLLSLSRVNRMLVKTIQIASLPLALLVIQLALMGNVAAQRSQVVDYMVATVNGSLITYSDLVWQLTLQPNSQIENPRREDLQRTLDLLISQRLIFQDAERLPHIHAEEREVEVAINELIRLFPSQAEFRERLLRTGLTTNQLREIISARVEIEKYLDFRFRSFTVVSAKEIENYYHEVYVPRFRQSTSASLVPKLEEVRSEIERQIAEDKVASDLQKYLDDAREKADIVILRQP